MYKMESWDSTIPIVFRKSIHILPMQKLIHDFPTENSVQPHTKLLVCEERDYKEKKIIIWSVIFMEHIIFNAYDYLIT